MHKNCKKRKRFVDFLIHNLTHEFRQSSDGEMAIVRIYDGAGSEKMVGVGSLPAIETARSGSTSGWTTIDRSRNGE